MLCVCMHGPGGEGAVLHHEVVRRRHARRVLPPPQPPPSGPAGRAVVVLRPVPCPGAAAAVGRVAVPVAGHAVGAQRSNGKHAVL